MVISRFGPQLSRYTKFIMLFLICGNSFQFIESIKDLDSIVCAFRKIVGAPHELIQIVPSRPIRIRVMSRSP